MGNPKGKGPSVEYRWKPGQSGNPGGRRSEKPFIDEVLKILKSGDGEMLRRIARKVVRYAEMGKPWAIQMLWDRLDGKAPQEIKLTRDVREMSLDEILGELAEVRAVARRTGSEDEGAGESDSVH